MDRARARRREWIGAVLTALTLVATIALAVAIPTQGENPSAWGVIVCGVVTAALCAQLALRNRRLLRHYRGDDLAPPPHGPSRQARSHRAGTHQTRAKAAR
ncbi:hypothetical protein [Leifsonia sp. 2MCAF36]|uniref:hypothetical protein n=1 Tax=Leifsonia sp. 2MCAF36 TaxID=3232988 RepID=UPI003F97F495